MDTLKDKPELVKDRECIHCEKFFECNGHPKEVRYCNEFKSVRDMR